MHLRTCGIIIPVHFLQTWMVSSLVPANASALSPQYLQTPSVAACSARIFSVCFLVISSRHIRQIVPTPLVVWGSPSKVFLQTTHEKLMVVLVSALFVPPGQRGCLVIESGPAQAPWHISQRSTRLQAIYLCAQHQKLNACLSAPFLPAPFG